MGVGNGRFIYSEQIFEVILGEVSFTVFIVIYHSIGESFFVSLALENFLLNCARLEKYYKKENGH